MSSHNPEFLRSYTLKLPKIIFGTNTVEKVGIEAKRYGKKALIVTDHNLEKIGLVDKVKAPLEKEGITADVFNQVKCEPEPEDIDPLGKLVRERRYDLVVGLGGGSCMDMTKAASILATNPGSIQGYISKRAVKKNGLPNISLPTTAGSGAENSYAIVLRLRGKKVIVRSPYCTPDVAIVDPVLTVSMPPKVTAATGIGAFCDGIDTYSCINANAFSDAVCLLSINLIWNNLRRAYLDGRNLEARYNMSLAAHHVGWVDLFGGAALIHAFAHAIGGLWRVPHGFACSAVLPYVLELTTKAMPKPRLVKLAEALGEETAGLSFHNVASKVVGATKKLLGDVNAPTLRGLGVTKADLTKIIDGVLEWDKYFRRSIVVPSKQDIVKITEKMWECKTWS